MRHIQAHSQAEASGVKHQVRPQRQASTETRQAPAALLSYNFLYWFKAARSAPRARPGPRPGLRSCLRPAPARPGTGPHSEQSAPDAREEVRRGWGGRLHGFSHLPGQGPASSKTRGPLVQIPGRITACPRCRPAYGPLIMLDPKPGRTPAKPAPPTCARSTGFVGRAQQYQFDASAPEQPRADLSVACLPTANPDALNS